MLPFFVDSTLLFVLYETSKQKFLARGEDIYMGNNYFKETILPSVKLPYKGSYSIPEACIIMGCNRTTLWRMDRRGTIKIAPNKKVYCREFENLFNGKESS